MQQSDAVVPVIQVRNLDFSYGKVQVLFDVGFEVFEGETLALLGTNGAGKSTLLRVISGLGVAERGVVRFRGRTVTYADPELRVRVGIVQLIGGGATFAPLTVRENLRMAAFLYTRREQERRIDKALELFPVLRERFDTPAARAVRRPAADARAGDDARCTNPRCSSSTSSRSVSRRSSCSRCSRSSSDCARPGSR